MFPSFWDTTPFAVPPPSQPFRHPPPPPLHTAEQTPLPAAWQRPWETGRAHPGPPVIGNKSWNGCCSQGRWSREFSFHLYLLFLGLLFCCMGEAESKRSSGALALFWWKAEVISAQSFYRNLRTAALMLPVLQCCHLSLAATPAPAVNSYFDISFSLSGYSAQNGGILGK